MAVTTMAPSAPMEAASVGAATPAMIEPSTAPTSAIGGSTTLQQFSDELASRDEVTFILRHCRDHLRTKDAEAEQVDDIDAGKHQAGDHRGREQRADRLVQNVCEQDQDEAGRDDLAERAGGANNSARDGLCRSSRRSSVGSVSNPSVTTVAPTIPVVAPISTPTRMMPMPRPPRRLSGGMGRSLPSNLLPAAIFPASLP